MILNKKLIHYNYSHRKNQKIRYLVIHDTGNPRPGADAIAHYRYFGGGNRQASAHYFVDDKGVVQIIEDAWAAWHCGDGRGRYGITNFNSIGIEICINQDGNYEKAVENTLTLTRELMVFYGISKDHVLRHYDASRKICPRSMSGNQWEKWKAFKNKL